MKTFNRMPSRWLPLLAIAACGSTESTPPREVTLEASSAPAGSMLKVDGLDLDACPLRTSEIRVAGQTAPTVLNARHEALMRLPLFYDEGTKWAAPPSDPQDVDIFCNGSLWLTLPAAITITELPPAPGTTESMVAEYQQIISDYKALTESLAPTPGILHQLFAATFAALEELVAGEDPRSLLAQLQQLKDTEPEVLALMDAVYAIDGTDEVVAAYRERIQTMSAEVAPPAPLTPAINPKSTRGSPSAETQGVTPPTSITPKGGLVFELPFAVSISDTNLAQLMRSHDGIEAFAKDFIAPTAEAFGTFEGLLSLVVKSKLASTINAVLSMLDYTLNKLVVSAMPSSLDEIDLMQVPPLLDNSEVTSSNFVVRASNVPEVLTITDIASAVIMTIGLAEVPGASASEEVLDWTKILHEKLEEVGKLFLETLSRFLKDFAKEPGGFEFDLDAFAVVPQMRFEAAGETPELYALYPQRSQVIKPLPNQLQWKASDIYWGSAHVWVTPAARAFGPHSTESEHIRVQVGQLALILDEYSVIVPEGETASVGVKLSNAPPAEEGPVEVFAIRVAGDADITVASQLPMIFDDTNWDDFRDITLAAAEDDDQDDDDATVVVSTVVDAVGDEPIRVEASLTATEEDNDRPRFIIDPSHVRVPEGETAGVGVKLSEPPPFELAAIVKFSSGDRDLQVQSPTLMRFDENNWDSFQTVTLHAEPDADVEEGKAQFRVSANPPAKVDEVYITATEDEPGDSLSFRWVFGGQLGYENITYTVDGAVQVTIDDGNLTSSLGTGSVFWSRRVESADPSYETGAATLTVRNHWSDTICYCGSADTSNCYTKVDPNHILAVDVVFPGSSSSREIVVIVGEDSPYSVSYNCGGQISGSIQASLH